VSRYHEVLEKAWTERTPLQNDVTIPPTRKKEKVHTSVTVHPVFDNIVQRLLGRIGNKGSQIILVVGSVPEEGTSTMAVNLAKALGQTSMTKVVLVDANLRNPIQHGVFRLTRNGGLTDVVAGALTLDAAVQNGHGPGLSVLTSGRPTRSPSQLLTLESFKRVLSDLKSQFHFVILDAPPATAYPDAGTLAALSDGIVLVIRAERTRWEVVEEAKKILDESNVPILGAVLNRRKFHIPAGVYERL
jgi:capsular exopolysaccharide synthesis family protein